MNEQQTMYGYVRVSTKEQHEDRQIIAMRQLGILEKNIYIDKQTGKNTDRPGYQRLLRRLDNNSILYIKSLDRLGRNYRDLSEQWRIITKEKNADIVVLDMPILDTRVENGLVGIIICDLVLTLLSYVAETEYDFIHKRQAEGIAAAKAKGKKMGRPRKPLPDNFIEVVGKWQNGDISMMQAATLVGMPKSTFRYKVYNWIAERNV